MNDYREITEKIELLFRDSALCERSYFERFRAEWGALLQKAAASGDVYFDAESDAAFAVPCGWGGLDAVFHFDQSKLADWYFQEVKRKKRVVFLPDRVKRDRAGNLKYHDSPCHYDPGAAESAIGKADRNILAAAMPGLPPELWIVYGNKWVERRFNPLLQRSLPLFLIQTDYVPAFLATPLEICLYLFMMDCCIIKADYEQVKDEELQNYLHIFRPSPMLKIKGLL